MDLVTQAALGAALGELTAGRELGWRGAAWGAALGLLPDADALLRPFLSDLQELTWHRSLTHSVLFCALATPLLGRALPRLQSGWSRASATTLVGLALATHVLLDCATTWGTQVAWPFSSAALTLRLVSVVDPLVTLPLLGGLALARARGRPRAAALGLGLAALYLLGLGAAKLWVGRVLATTLHAEGLAASRLQTKPTFANGLLWRATAELSDGEQVWVGYYSLLDPAARFDHVRTVPRRLELLGPVRADGEVARLLEVLDGQAAVAPLGSGLVIQDLRYGQWRAWERTESPYVFAYAVEEGRVRVLPRVRPGAGYLGSFLARVGGRVPAPRPGEEPAQPR